jgi:glycosyltransferase involved in cell wall biosynthesis
MVNDALPWYGVADLFALISDVESMPRSLMETMYLGLPSLATSVYGVPELIDDGQTGFLVEVNHTAKLADKLDTLLSAPKADLDSVARQARQLIRDKYRSSGYANAYRELIKELTGTTAK